MIGLLALSAILVPVKAQVCDNVYPHLSAGLKYSTKESCQGVGCCWDGNANSCFMPKINGYVYTETSSTDNGFGGELVLKESSQALGGNDFQNLDISFLQETKHRVHMRISPKGTERWEVPESVLKRPTDTSNLKGSDMQYHIIPDPFQLVIRRSKSTQDLFFMSKMLVFQDQYIQFVLGTPKNTVATFGFGESTRYSQKLELNETYSLWATDYAASNYDKSLYGSHPFFVQVLDDGTAHGAFILNSNAMEASYHHDDTQGNTIGVQIAGGMIDMYFFSGSSPSDVIRQYQEVIGRPYLVPFWSLGFHNCRWGYSSLDYVKEVVGNYSLAAIPLETQWVDIDYMDKFLDFTVDPVNFPAADMKSFIQELNNNGQHFVPIVDPGISAVMDEANPYDALVQGLAQNVFINDLTNEKPYLGQVWPGNTYFPDFFAKNATSYWEGQLKDFHQLLPYSGIWIDMNEVSNFCNNNGWAQSCEIVSKDECADGCCGIKCTVVDPTNKYDNAPYVPHVAQGSLGGKTLAMSAIHQDGKTREYDAHSLYGLMESQATHSAVAKATGQRPFVLSRSTFPSSGVYTAHWTGDNAATWDNLESSIVTMNTLSLFGQSTTGADICGFGDDTTEELCARWIEVGAFSPFSRNHNAIGRLSQELYRWESVTVASRNVLTLRYKLLSHLYTLLYRASTEGITVMNALWVHFPSDAAAIQAQGQYMWYDTIMFSPVLKQGASSILAYFPTGIWYSLFDDAIVTGPQSVELNTPLTATNAHIRGGSVVPMQEFAMTTRDVKQSAYTVIVAMDAQQQSHGSLYLDDGVSLPENTVATIVNFSYENNVFTSKRSVKEYAASNVLKQVEFWGVEASSTAACSAVVEGNKFSGSHTYDASYDANAKKLVVTFPESAMNINEDYTITWKCV